MGSKPDIASIEFAPLPENTKQEVWDALDGSLTADQKEVLADLLFNSGCLPPEEPSLMTAKREARHEKFEIRTTGPPLSQPAYRAGPAKAQAIAEEVKKLLKEQ